ncbi:hypothetical protein PVNG_05680 [Plasmodium vivax North Korean]|uniref:Variable surface protein Vir35 n=1 Tax=Plasmodium vivax North Korean TaxID=1035514 RepID=A0A0J9WDB3_PLAVI|nr:hypothetical protein PVNG_05680 [Plasmodium vivax North Korean]
MILLKSFNFKDNIKYLVIFKIITFIIFIWIYEPNNVCSFGKGLDRINNGDITNNTSFYRSLAKHEIYKNSKYQKNREKLYENRMNMNINYDKIDRKTYEQLQKGINYFQSYKKNYKKRYISKKGLAKIDCYLENIVFDKIEYVDNLAESLRNKKNAHIKLFFNKYTMGFILFSLLPLLGIIFPTLFSGRKLKERLFKWTTFPCNVYCRKQEPNVCALCKDGYAHLFVPEGSFLACGILNALITYTLVIISTFVGFYTLIKIIKYIGLKSGKGKMNKKEYYNLCKELLKNKKY